VLFCLKKYGEAIKVSNWYPFNISKYVFSLSFSIKLISFLSETFLYASLTILDIVLLLPDIFAICFKFSLEGSLDSFSINFIIFSNSIFNSFFNNMGLIPSLIFFMPSLYIL